MATAADASVDWIATLLTRTNFFGTLVHVKGRSPGPTQGRALIVDNDWPAVREKQRLSPGLKVLSALHLGAGTFAAWG
jgi:hypothetical protein